MFTRTTFSVSFLHISAVSVDNPSLPCAPVHVLPPFLWTVCGSDMLPSTKMPPFVDGMQKEALLFLLQRLGGVGAGGAEGLPEDGQEGDGE